jgi:hypothetical protein
MLSSLLVAAVGLIGGLLVHVMGVGFFESLVITLVTLGVGALIWLRYPILLQAGMRKSAEKLARSGRNLTALGEHWITLTPQEFQVRTLYSFTSVDWRAIERIDSTPDYLFVFFSAFTGTSIRLADLPNSASREQFVRTVFDHFHSQRGVLT